VKTVRESQLILFLKCYKMNQNCQKQKRFTNITEDGTPRSDESHREKFSIYRRKIKSQLL